MSRWQLVAYHRASGRGIWRDGGGGNIADQRRCGNFEGQIADVGVRDLQLSLVDHSPSGPVLDSVAWSIVDADRRWVRGPCSARCDRGHPRGDTIGVKLDDERVLLCQSLEVVMRVRNVGTQQKDQK